MMGCLSPLLAVYFSSPLYVKEASREAPTASVSVIFVMFKPLIWVEVSKTKTEKEWKQRDKQSNGTSLSVMAS